MHVCACACMWLWVWVRARVCARTSVYARANFFDSHTLRRPSNPLTSGMAFVAALLFSIPLFHFVVREHVDAFLFPSSQDFAHSTLMLRVMAAVRPSLVPEGTHQQGLFSNPRAPTVNDFLFLTSCIFRFGGPKCAKMGWCKNDVLGDFSDYFCGFVRC